MSYSKEIIKKTILDIIGSNSVLSKTNKAEWGRYNASFKDRFGYLTKVGEFDLPMKERNVPLQRRYLDLLIAKKSRRPFQYSVYIDSESVRKKKYEDRIRAYVDFAIDKAERISMDYNNKISTIEQNMQSIQEMMGQSQQQGQQINPEDIQKVQSYLQELDYYKRAMEKEKILNNEYLEEFEIQQKMTPTAILEKIATKYMKHLYRIGNFNYISTMQFKNRVVTGHQNYMVAQFDDENPLPRELDNAGIVYQQGGAYTTIQQKDWAY